MVAAVDGRGMWQVVGGNSSSGGTLSLRLVGHHAPTTCSRRVHRRRASDRLHKGAREC